MKLTIYIEILNANDHNYNLNYKGCSLRHNVNVLLPEEFSSTNLNLIDKLDVFY